MKRFLIFHDYGCEGWRIVKEADSLIEAVEKREAYIEGVGGGHTIICEYLPAIQAYAIARNNLCQGRAIP